MLRSELKQWVGQELGSHDFQFDPLQGDASFRTYYRIKQGERSYIAMLAPPLKERTDAFVAIAKAWKQVGIPVPEVLAWHQQQGFVLLSDFGDTLLLEVLNQETVDNFYLGAIEHIIALQDAQTLLYDIPPYDEAYVRLELGLFEEWFLRQLLGLQLDKNGKDCYEDITKRLVDNFTSQPQVVVHRDFHSRNLMVCDDGALGIIDFQDAMIGPITYDLVSLLKDCYIDWPREDIKRWVGVFFDELLKAKKISPMDFQTFLKWFDCVGLQRHLKVLGIFSRLKLRDNKPQYLQYFPRIVQYILEVTNRYPELAQFDELLQTQVLPILQAREEAVSS